MLKKFFIYILKFAGFAAIFVFCFLAQSQKSRAAILSASPSSGTFTVGSTFDVAVYLNTEGKSANAIEASLSFPPDKLQLVSPSAGKSVIGVWTVQPSVNNQTGKIDLQGGIPGGINVSSGLVTTLTFRVKSVGTVAIKFSDNSKVLLNDGKGTNDLNNTTNGVYNLVLPPPAGPIVSSETHPDQSVWYNSPNVVLSWAGDDQVEGYSYEISSDPIGAPDDIIDSSKTNVSYRNLSNGLHYFHIKALRKGSWGGITHFALKIDTQAPADFTPEVIPGTRTVRTQPIIQFSTTDSDSGLDHYELKLISLSPNLKGSSQGQPLFIEVTSPFIPAPLSLGRYDVIVRAYDKANNFTEKTVHLSIVTSTFSFISDEGVQISSNIVVPWKVFIPAFVAILLGLIYLASRLKKWHKYVDTTRQEKVLPEHIKKQLKELSVYRAKYGKSLLIIVFLSLSIFGINKVQASTSELPPPLITTLSRSISNEDIFYVGGKTDTPSTQVIIHLQNLQSGETLNNEALSDKKGDWFYRHDTFLPSGNYIIWVQTRVGNQDSPPSPQDKIAVKATALQFGASRISFELLYLIIIILLLLAVVFLIVYIIFHARQGSKKHKMLSLEIRAAEESVRRGFALIKKDLEAELALVRKFGLNSQEEKEKEALLVKDLNEIEERIGKEIWEIEKLEHV